jgi:hypothetical protein
MISAEDRTETVRVLLALVVVVAAAIALLVAVGVAVGRVAPDFGDDDIVEADDGVRTYPDANALMVAVGCADPQPFSAFEGISTRIRSYAQPSGAWCPSDGTFGLVYVDRDDRRVAEDDNDVRDRACATLEVDDADSTATTVAPAGVEPTAPPPTDPAATAATAAPTTAAVTTTTAAPETKFGFVRGPNWILATAAGEDAANALNGRLGGVVFTKTCEPETD